MKELSFEQMECINGGGWVNNALAWVGNSLSEAWDFISGLASSLVFSITYDYQYGIGNIYSVTMTGYF